MAPGCDNTQGPQDRTSRSKSARSVRDGGWSLPLGVVLEASFDRITRYGPVSRRRSLVQTQYRPPTETAPDLRKRRSGAAFMPDRGPNVDQGRPVLGIQGPSNSRLSLWPS